MNNNIEVGDTVRLVKGNNLFSDPEFQKDFVVRTIQEDWIEVNGSLIPMEWFEIMKGKDEPELEEAMFDIGKFEKLMEDLHDVCYMYFTGEDTEDYALRNIRGLMNEFYSCDPAK